MGYYRREAATVYAGGRKYYGSSRKDRKRKTDGIARSQQYLD